MPVDLNSINPALLQFCLKHHDDERFQELQQDRNPSDYEWLKNVLEAMAGESSGHAIERMLEQIDKQPPISDSELVLILEELQQIAEQFDNAIHMARVGSERILKLLSHKCDDVRYHTLHIIATCSLHNKAACLSMIEAGALAKVIDLMNNATNEVERVRSKIVTALSALTSTASVSRQFFLKSRQFPAFRQLLLSSEKAATRSKIFFFANKLARNEPIARHAFSQPQTGLLEPAAAALSESGIENMSMRSNAATLLVTLLDPPPLPEPDTPPLLLAAPPSSATTTAAAAAPSPLPSNDTAAAPAITDTLEQLHLPGIVVALLSDIEQSGDDARSDELAVVKQLRTLLSASQ